jgi:hypothetical protein
MLKSRFRYEVHIGKLEIDIVLNHLCTLVTFTTCQLVHFDALTRCGRATPPFCRITLYG